MSAVAAGAQCVDPVSTKTVTYNVTIHLQLKTSVKEPLESPS